MYLTVFLCTVLLFVPATVEVKVCNKQVVHNNGQTATMVKGNRFVGAYYYVWYEGVWSLNDNTPLLGYYQSSNETVIQEHLEWAATARLDFLMVSWSNSPNWCHGKNPNVTETLFKVADRIGSPVKLAIMVEYWHGEFLNITEAADYVYNNYVPSPSYFQLYGKPLLYVYTLDDYSEPTWGDSRFTVRYIPLQGPYGRDTVIESAIMKGSTYELTGVGVHKDNYHLNRCRANGTYYRYIWNQVLQFSVLRGKEPLVVMVTSFNEWWESTNIEPCLNYGYQYINLTRQYVSELQTH